MFSNVDQITPLMYKMELLKGRNVSLILISFNVLILIILLIQEFLYISEHKEFEIIIIAIIVTKTICLNDKNIPLIKVEYHIFIG